MKYLTILWIALLLISIEVHGQSVFSAHVIDAQKEIPIPYVNVGIVKKGIGTVTDEYGYFELDTQKRLSPKDILQISIVGYKTKVFTVEELRDVSKDFSIIKLIPEPIGLDEVVIEKLIEEERTIGYSKYTKEHFGYWKDKQGLGGEIATRIRIKKEQTKLLKLNFKLIENETDSVLLRVNVYDYKKRYPVNNLVNSQIYHTVHKGEKDISIDLSPYGVIVNDDVVVSIELIKVYGDKLEIAIAGAYTKVSSFTRAISQDKWKRYKGDGIAFSVKIGQLKSEHYALNKKRVPPKNITIFWDASRSMKKRDFEKEYELLSTYLESLNTSKIELVIFNSRLQNVLYFDCKKGTLPSDFKMSLENIFYDGMANYDHLSYTSDFTPDRVFLFSDATSFIGELKVKYDAPVFAINSLAYGNEERLQSLSLYTDGHYINPTKVSFDKALSFMTYDLEDFQVYEQKEDKNYWIKGNVTIDSIPFQGVNIRILGTYKEEITNSNGDFSIQASVGEELLFSHIGAVSQRITIKNNDQPLSINLKPEGDFLDEVVISGKEKKKKRGIQKMVKYAIEEVTSNQINPTHTTLENVLLANTSVRYRKTSGGGIYEFPRSYKSPGIISGAPSIMLDGLIYDQRRTLPYINPQEISSISIVNPLTAKNRFGDEASGGLIVIRTKKFQTGMDEAVSQGKNKTLTNYYNENLDIYDASLSKTPFIEPFSQIQTLEEAYTIYKNDSPHIVRINYYLEVAQFISKWDHDIAYEILTNVIYLSPDNPKILRIVAGYFEQFKKYKEAEYLYEEIAKIRPLEAQSHRDLAMIYEVNGKYKDAIDLYKKMLVQGIQNIDFSTIKPLLNNELSRLIVLHGTEILSSDALKNFSIENSLLDARWVLNWSQPQAKFKIQFVSPEKFFFKWDKSKSNKFANSTREGLSLEEFILDNAHKGEWLINLEYSDVANDYLIPLYIKYTFYKDYGSPQETKEVKMIRLLREHKKVTLGKVVL